MKIIYLKLVNFAGIYAAMKKKEISYDLKDSRNNIILLIGENGSGKTTILSNLHPFAYPGNMDVRNECGLIIETLIGVKEITFIHGGNEIFIKHVYTPTSTGHTIKSFIKVNNEEKNPNGNVKSFKEMVECYLDVEQDYLKLTRLGSNVVGFIDMKSTERKNYSSQLLSDVDIYSEYYKKINDDARLSRNLMKSLSDKLFRLKITNEAEFRGQMMSVDYELDSFMNEMNDIKTKISINNYQISKECPGGADVVKSELKALKGNLPDILKKINTYEKRLEGLTMPETDIKYNVTKLRECEMKSSGLQSEAKSLRSQMDKLYHKRDEAVTSLEKICGDSNRDDLLILKNKLTETISSFNIEEIPNLNASKSELLSAYSLCQNISSLLSNLFAYSHHQTKDIMERIINGYNIDTDVKHRVAKIDNELATIDKSIIEISGLVQEDDAIRVMYKTLDTCDKCPYVLYYDEKNEKNDLSINIETLNTKKKSLLMQRDLVLQDLDIKSIIVNVMNTCRMNSAILDKIDNMNFKFIWDAYFDDNVLSAEDVISGYIEYVETMDERKSLEDKLQSVNIELNLLAASENEINNIKKSITEINDEIESLDKLYLQNSNKLTEVGREIIEVEDSISIIENIDEFTKQLHDATKEYQELSEKINTLQLSLDNVNTLITDTELMGYKLVNIERNIGITESKLNTMRYTMMQYEEITKEQEELVIKFDELTILKEALSANKGIPLLYIQLYLKNTRIIANNLLSHIYNGGDELELGEFVINDKEFRIPYNRHGMEISDVVYASQGERSFISLAISFALMQQSLKAYNVLLLDEIDATLDQRNRNKFIQILEKQLASISCEQVFMITHNNVFDNYPVDIIATSELELDNYRNIGEVF